MEQTTVYVTHERPLLEEVLQQQHLGNAYEAVSMKVTPEVKEAFDQLGHKQLTDEETLWAFTVQVPSQRELETFQSEVRKRIPIAHFSPEPIVFLR